MQCQCESEPKPPLSLQLRDDGSAAAAGPVRRDGAAPPRRLRVALLARRGGVAQHSVRQVGQPERYHRLGLQLRETLVRQEPQVYLPSMKNSFC